MIYDKHQFTFNLILSVLLVVLILMLAFFGKKYLDIKSELEVTNEILDEMRDFNYIQAPHFNVRYLKNPDGFFVYEADDFGGFSGPSMQPAIFDGNTLIEITYKGQELKAGQIVRYLKGSAAIVHRIRAVYPDKVFIQGDNEKEGEIVSKDDITHLIVGVLYT